MPPPPPPLAFEKKFPIIYISIKNLLLAIKLIYLAPPLPNNLQADPWNQKWKKLSNHPLSGCLKNIKENIKLNIWTIYKFEQQGKSIKQFTYSDYNIK